MQILMDVVFDLIICLPLLNNMRQNTKKSLPNSVMLRFLILKFIW